jgi:pimeloyl-ACP methyl ester carboxylesterase
MTIRQNLLDEWSLLKDNADEFGIPWKGRPAMQRTSVALADGRKLSAIVWGTGSPDLVLVHGGAQNAHTWDTLALALDRPLVAVDLPGHGRSDWKDDGNYAPLAMADDVAVAVGQLAPEAKAVVGMSLGGLTSICLASRHPDLVRRLVIVDVTPGTNKEKASAIIAFVDGPQEFDDFDTLLQRTMQFNPTRSESSLRRGILHNAEQGDDGKWRWRYDRTRREGELPDIGSLWDEVDRIAAPLLLVRGADSPVVGDEDVAELTRRQPAAEIVVVEGAGHSIQGDKPVELARIIEGFALA